MELNMSEELKMKGKLNFSPVLTFDMVFVLLEMLQFQNVYCFCSATKSFIIVNMSLVISNFF